MIINIVTLLWLYSGSLSGSLLLSSWSLHPCTHRHHHDPYMIIIIMNTIITMTPLSRSLPWSLSSLQFFLLLLLLIFINVNIIIIVITIIRIFTSVVTWPNKTSKGKEYKTSLFLNGMPVAVASFLFQLNRVNQCKIECLAQEHYVMPDRGIVFMPLWSNTRNGNH